MHNKETVYVYSLFLCGASRSLVLVPTVTVELLSETADPCEEPVKKKQRGRRSEAVSQRLLAVGNKLKHVFISG